MHQIYNSSLLDAPDLDVEKMLEEVLDSDVKNDHNLILWNDDVNSFDHVIASLIDICDHTPQQAEQCAMIVHNRGKCGVKKGTFEFLRPMAEGLIDRGINATID